jgi:hypothetical protein
MPKIKTSNQVAPLQGKELLKKVKDLAHLSRRKKAIECGYYLLGDNNQQRAKIAEFLEAILEAQGIKLSDGRSKDGRGREASYRVSVHKNGSIVIGSAYTSEMGLTPGDEFEIKLGYKHIHLNQIKSGE